MTNTTKTLETAETVSKAQTTTAQQKATTNPLSAIEQSLAKISVTDRRALYMDLISGNNEITSF